MAFIKSLTFSARGLLLFDFAGALVAGVVYFLLYDFLMESLDLPRWVIRAQLAANLLYGVYGASLFGRRATKRGYFEFLVGMNFLYASLCFLVALSLALRGVYGAALLLASEGGFIALLATLERRVWLKHGPSS